MNTKNDHWLRRAFVALLLLNAALCMEHFWPSSVAQAQVADSGAQLQRLIDLTRQSNELLTRIADRLDRGAVTVKIAPKDDAAAGKEKS